MIYSHRFKVMLDKLNVTFLAELYNANVDGCRHEETRRLSDELIVLLDAKMSMNSKLREDDREMFRNFRVHFYKMKVGMGAMKSEDKVMEMQLLLQLLNECEEGTEWGEVCN